MVNIFQGVGLGQLWPSKSCLWPLILVVTGVTALPSYTFPNIYFAFVYLECEVRHVSVFPQHAFQNHHNFLKRGISLLLKYCFSDLFTGAVNLTFPQYG